MAATCIDQSSGGRERRKAAAEMQRPLLSRERSPRNGEVSRRSLWSRHSMHRAAHIGALESHPRRDPCRFVCLLESERIDDVLLKAERRVCPRRFH